MSVQPPGACAKFILGGEHSVVYRGRAIAIPVPQWRLQVNFTDHEKLTVNGEIPTDPSLWEKIQKVMALYTATPPKGVQIQSQIPMGKGLGSSAALCTALARALTKSVDTELAALALKGETIFHGTPSGVDPYTVALEEPVLFQAKPQMSVRSLSLQKLNDAGLCFVLKDSGEEHSTQKIVAAVQQTKSETPLIWEDLMDALSSNVEAMLMALENNPRKVGRLMNDTHFRLLQLGVSTEKLDTVADDCRTAGALGAKLTGAGGGGYVVALFENDVARSLDSSFTVLPTISVFS